MCGYLCIRFIDFMLKGKSLLDYTNLFSPNKYEMNHKIILKYFLSFYPILEFLQISKKICSIFCGKYRKFANPKTSFIFKKILPLSVICSKCIKIIYSYFKR